MRILLSQESRKTLFNFLKKKYKTSKLTELAQKMNVSYKTLNHWHYDYKKYLPAKLLEDFEGDLEILDRKSDNWGQSNRWKKVY